MSMNVFGSRSGTNPQHFKNKQNKRLFPIQHQGFNNGQFMFFGDDKKTVQRIFLWSFVLRVRVFVFDSTVCNSENKTSTFICP